MKLILQILFSFSMLAITSSFHSFSKTRKFNILPIHAVADDDEDFYQSLEKAKLRLGGEIPPEQASAEAERAQNEFLDAMNQVSKKFEEDKKVLGVDEAISMMKDQWDQEEKLRDALENEEEDGEFE